MSSEKRGGAVTHWAENADDALRVEVPKASNMFTTTTLDAGTEETQDGIKSYHEPDAKWDAIQADLPALTKALPAARQDKLTGVAVKFLQPAALEFPECSVGSIIAALHRDGAVIIKNAVSKETCEKVIAEMTPYVDEY
eukprot:gene16879-16853_t